MDKFGRFVISTATPHNGEIFAPCLKDFSATVEMTIAFELPEMLQSSI